MFIKKKYLIFILLALVFRCGMDVYNRNKLPVEYGINNPDFIKISPNKKTIFYQDSNTGEWLELLKISQVNNKMIAYLIPWFYAEIFTKVTLTPDKNKLIISVCNDVLQEGDFSDTWHLLYDLHNGSLIDIPGNHVIGFSPNHHLVFTSYLNDGIPGETNVSVVDLITGEVLLSHDIFYP